MCLFFNLFNDISNRPFCINPNLKLNLAYREKNTQNNYVQLMVSEKWELSNCIKKKNIEKLIYEFRNERDHKTKMWKRRNCTKLQSG